MTKINIDTNEAISLQCDIGYINLTKGLEKTNTEWTGSRETSQMKWRDKFETHFEWKHVHSLHSLGAKNRPMSITFILTHPGRFRHRYRINRFLYLWFRVELPPRGFWCNTGCFPREVSLRSLCHHTEENVLT